MGECPECGSVLVFVLMIESAARGRKRRTWCCSDCGHRWEVLR